VSDEYQRKLTELWLDLLKGGFKTLKEAQVAAENHPIPHVRAAIRIAAKEFQNK
jgi:hypothetical protein